MQACNSKSLILTSPSTEMIISSTFGKPVSGNSSPQLILTLNGPAPAGTSWNKMGKKLFMTKKMFPLKSNIYFITL